MKYVSLPVLLLLSVSGITAMKTEEKSEISKANQLCEEIKALEINHM